MLQWSEQALRANTQKSCKASPGELQERANTTKLSNLESVANLSFQINKHANRTCLISLSHMGMRAHAALGWHARSGDTQGAKRRRAHQRNFLPVALPRYKVPQLLFCWFPICIGFWVTIAKVQGRNLQTVLVHPTGGKPVLGVKRVSFTQAATLTKRTRIL